MKILLLSLCKPLQKGRGAAPQRLAQGWRKISAKSAQSVQVSLDAQRAQPDFQIRNVYTAAKAEHKQDQHLCRRRRPHKVDRLPRPQKPYTKTRCTFEELKAFLQKTKTMNQEDVVAIAKLTELYIQERVAATKKKEC